MTRARLHYIWLLPKANSTLSKDTKTCVTNTSRNIDVEGVNKATPFTMSLSKGTTEIAELLISAGANVHHRILTGFTTLMLAIQYANKPLIQLLLDHDVVVDDAEICHPNHRTASCCKYKRP